MNALLDGILNLINNSCSLLSLEESKEVAIDC
jgi:hypothetical protein